MNDIKSPSSNEINELKTPSDTENNSFDPDKRIDVDQKENTEDKKDNSGYDVDKRVDVAEKEGTTTEERINFASHSNGEWSGEAGNSLFTPNLEAAKEKLSEYGQDCIEYKDGNPDFENCSEATVKIENMSSNRASNFRQADTACAEKWNAEAKDDRTDWTSRDVKEWRQDNTYSWHERIDMKTMDLVPREIHEECKHYGGVAECKRFETGTGLGGKFDV